MINKIPTQQENEIQIRQMVENWVQAVKNRDLATILAYHSDNIVMYDVPKPFQSTGIEAYRKTWDTFFAYTKPGVFDIHELTVYADNNVAFCFATMRCADKSGDTGFVELDFRLTIDFIKINDQWTFNTKRIKKEHTSLKIF